MLRGRFSVKKARRLQLRLSTQVVKKNVLPKTLRYVAGVDVSYTGEWAFGAVVVLNYNSLAVVETQRARARPSIPYIPTLLSFREIKPSLIAIRKLTIPPDVFLVDAQGIAHPYRLGFASHLGVLLDKPTIGVGKSLLCGQIQPVNREGWSPITDKGEVIGGAIGTNEDQKPIYVSIGHKISLQRAMEIVRHCKTSARIPEPIRIAHILATKERNKHKQKITLRS